MISSEKQRLYTFGHVEIEVRLQNDPVIMAGVLSNYTYSFGNTFV